MNLEICWRFDDGTSAGLLLRDQVAIPTNGSTADMNVELSHEVWARILSGKISPEQAVIAGEIEVQGSIEEFLRVVQVFDLWYEEA